MNLYNCGKAPQAKRAYFVAITELGKPRVILWTATKAKTVDGAKRLAAKLPRGITSTAQVAVQNSKDEFVTIATLDDYSAITRRRPMWRMHQVSTEQASA